MRRRDHLRRPVVMLACLVLISAACTPRDVPPDAGARTDLRLATYPSAATLPARAADTRGIFARNGLRVDVTEGNDLPLFMAALAKGQYDIAMTGPTLALIGAEKGLDLQIVSSMQWSTRERPNAVWISRDPGVSTLAQLKSKTVAVPSLTGVIMDSLVYLLMRDGVRRDEVRFVEMPFAAMGDQLAAGRVDAALATIPFSAAITARGFQQRDDVIVEAVRAASGGTVDMAMTSVWAASGPFARAHPEAVHAFRQSLSEGIDLLDANESDARAMMRDWLKMPARIADQSPLPKWGVEVTAQQLAPYVTIAKAVGSVKGDPDVDALVWRGP